VIINITFDLVVQEKSFAITLSPSRDNISILTSLRKDIWRKSEVQNIINTLNLVEIPVDSSNDYLKDEYSNAVNKELQRQCDIWNSKL
jgi:allophanate hydrolase subunit 1